MPKKRSQIIKDAQKRITKWSKQQKQLSKYRKQFPSLIKGCNHNEALIMNNLLDIEKACHVGFSMVDYGVYPKSDIKRVLHESKKQRIKDFGGNLILTKKRDCSYCQFFDTNAFVDHTWWDYDKQKGHYTYVAMPVTIADVKEMIKGMTKDLSKNGHAYKRNQHELTVATHRKKLFSINSIRSRIIYYLKIHPTATVNDVTRALHLNKRWKRSYKNAVNSLNDRQYNLGKSYTSFKKKYSIHAPDSFSLWDVQIASILNYQIKERNDHLETTIKDHLYKSFMGQGNPKVQYQIALNMKDRFKKINKSTSHRLAKLGLRNINWTGSGIKRIAKETLKYMIAYPKKHLKFKDLQIIYKRYYKDHKRYLHVLVRDHKKHVHKYLSALHKRLN